MWRRVLVVWSASRLAVLSLGLLLTTQLGWHRALEPWQTKFFRSITGWDSVYYLKISHTGYHPGKDLAFFPLYPATIWTTREVLRSAMPSRRSPSRTSRCSSGCSGCTSSPATA